MSGNCLPSITRTNKEGTIYVVADGGQGTASTFQYLRTQIFDVAYDTASIANTMRLESFTNGASIGWSETAPDAPDSKQIILRSSITNSIGGADPAGGFLFRPTPASSVFMEFGGTTPNGVLRMGSGVNDITALNATVNVDTVITNNLTTDDATVNFLLNAEAISCITTVACEDLYADNSISTYDVIINRFGDSNIITLNSTDDRLEVENNAGDTNTIAYTSDQAFGQLYISTNQAIVSGANDVIWTVAQPWTESNVVNWTPGSSTITIKQDGIYNLQFVATHVPSGGATWTATTNKVVAIDIARLSIPETGVITSAANTASGVGFSQFVNGIISLQSNDVINCRVNNTYAGGSVALACSSNALDPNTYFSWKLEKRL